MRPGRVSGRSAREPTTHRTQPHETQPSPSRPSRPCAQAQGARPRAWPPQALRTQNIPQVRRPRHLSRMPLSSGRAVKPSHTATGIRTRVSAMRGRRPSPLDDSGENRCPEASKAGGPSPRDPATAASVRPPCDDGWYGLRSASTISSPAHTRMWRNW